MNTEKLASVAGSIVPVVVLEQTLSAQAARALIAAVQQGGSQCLEITLRTSAALPSIAVLKAQAPNFIVGAGTVLDVKQAKAAMDAGSDFLVSPGLSQATVDCAKRHDNIMIAGIATPTEAQQAMQLGLNLVKFFPAEAAGGASMLAAFNSVYPSLQLMPTGGINLANLAHYSKLANVFAIGGSWVATSSDIASAKWQEISHKLKAANQFFK